LELKQKIKTISLPFVIIFGTGFSIAREIVQDADYQLKPIRGSIDYNHLSVRSAVAIYMDRINDG
jgi:hypothetical protein